jgi:hypothetical protein
MEGSPRDLISDLFTEKLSLASFSIDLTNFPNSGDKEVTRTVNKKLAQLLPANNIVSYNDDIPGVVGSRLPDPVRDTKK